MKKKILMHDFLILKSQTNIFNCIGCDWQHWHYLIFTSLCVAVKSELWAAGSAIRCLSPTSD
jgi:hypothetical protein